MLAAASHAHSQSLKLYLSTSCACPTGNDHVYAETDSTRLRILVRKIVSRLVNYVEKHEIDCVQTCNKYPALATLCNV